MSHTPGPWEPRRCGEQYYIFAESGLCLGEVYYVGSDGENGDTARNARLMAAAPETHERLCDALYYVDCAADEDPEAACLAKGIRSILSER